MQCQYSGHRIWEECNLQVRPGKRIPDVVCPQSLIDRIRAGFGVVPRNATVLDGYWRREDPVPALVHYSFQVLDLVQAAKTRL
jgi:D-aspartate ligase